MNSTKTPNGAAKCCASGVENVEVIKEDLEEVPLDECVDVVILELRDQIFPSEQTQVISEWLNGGPGPVVISTDC